MDKFIKISDDVILNVSSIMMITRQSVHSEEYDNWMNEFNTLMKDVIQEYMVTHTDMLEDDKSEDELADELFYKFSTIVKKNLEKSIGVQPEPFVHYYILKLKDNLEFPVTEDIFKKLCEIICLDPNETVKNKYLYDEDESYEG